MESGMDGSHVDGLCYNTATSLGLVCCAYLCVTSNMVERAGNHHQQANSFGSDIYLSLSIHCWMAGSASLTWLDSWMDGCDDYLVRATSPLNGGIVTGLLFARICRNNNNRERLTTVDIKLTRAKLAVDGDLAYRMKQKRARSKMSNFNYPIYGSRLVL